MVAAACASAVLADFYVVGYVDEERRLDFCVIDSPDQECVVIGPRVSVFSGVGRLCALRSLESLDSFDLRLLLGGWGTPSISGEGLCNF